MKPMIAGLSTFRASQFQHVLEKIVFYDMALKNLSMFGTLEEAFVILLQKIYILEADSAIYE